MTDNFINEDWDIFQKKFNEEVDTIFGEYGDFFSLPDPDYDFPTNPKEKYELFKDSTGRYQFYEIKWDYLKQAGREDDVNSIKAEIIDLQSITKHEKLKSEIEKLKLFKAAKDYFANAKVLGPIEGKGTSYTEEVTLYIYILHEMGYFNNYLLPDKAFYIDDTASNIKFLGEVYGKYFLFYPHLLKQAAKLGIEIPGTIEVNKKTSTKKPRTLVDIWVPTERSKYDNIMNELQKIELNNGQKIVKEIKGKLTWQREPPNGYQMYMAAFYYECEAANLINNEEFSVSVNSLKGILKRTFNTDDLSPEGFHKIKNDHLGLHKKYKEPFKKLIKKIMANS